MQVGGQRRQRPLATAIGDVAHAAGDSVSSERVDSAAARLYRVKHLVRGSGGCPDRHVRSPARDRSLLKAPQQILGETCIQ